MSETLRRKTVEIFSAASLLVSQACTPTNLPRNTQDLQKDPDPTPQSSIPTKLYDDDFWEEQLPPPMATAIAPISENNENQIQGQSDIEIVKPFNYEILNIADWSTYSIESVEEKEPGHVVSIAEETSMYIIPLRKDNFLDERVPVKEIILPYGSTFEIAKITTITNTEGNKIQIGLVANTYGAPAVSAILLGATDSNRRSINFVTKQETVDVSVSYVALENDIYPNKVENVLRALSNIAKYQEEEGPFKDGSEYSFLNIAGLYDPSKFREYILTGPESGVRAGGVCAMATGLSSLVHQANRDDVQIVEKWSHATKYFQGPFSPSKYTIDATVEMRVDGSNYDFRWIQGNTQYLKIDVSMTPSDILYGDTAQNGIGGLSDVNFIVSLSFTNKLPEDQTTRLQKQLQEYLAFRESHHEYPLEQQQEVNILEHEMTKPMRQIVNMIYNAEDLGPFVEYVESNNTIKDILSLQKAVNSYPVDSAQTLQKYLETTMWYKNFIKDHDKENTDKTLRVVSYTRIKNQPLQCVGFVMMVSSLYPELNVQYVGGAPVSSARELIPTELASPISRNIRGMATGYGGIAYAGKSITLKYYEVGDLFVLRDTAAMMAEGGGPTGHIGVVLGKTMKADGSIVLLVADSNRHSGGQIKIFTVDNHNIEEIFGSNQRYIIRAVKK